MNLGREHRGNAATAGERGVLAALVVAILLVAPTCASDGPTESGQLPAMGQLALSEYRDRLARRAPERGRCPDDATSPSFSISARLHLAYDVMGLLYGHGDLEESMRVAMRSGQDSDCTTHTVGEVLGTLIGFSSIDEKWTAGLDRTVMLMGTSYTFDQVINHSISAARAIVRARGGTITGEGTDSEAWTLPRELVAPPLLEVWPEDMNAVPQLEVHAVHEGARDFTFSVDVTDADGLGEVEWYFGDLSHAKGAPVSHRFAATGSYEVLVFASDRTGNSMGKRLDVEVD